MHAVLRVLLVICFVLFSACSPISPTFREAENHVLIPENKSLIYVYGSQIGHAEGQTKFIDNGSVVGLVDGGRYMKYFADPGLHEVKIDAAHTINTSKTLTMEPGKIYFFRVTFDRDFRFKVYYGEYIITQMHGGPELEEIMTSRLKS